MKVVHIVEALAGGVHTYFKDLSFFFGNEELNKGIETTIIYSGNRKEIDPKRIKDEFSNGVSLVELHMVRNFSPWQDLKSIIKLRRQLKKLNPDVVHLHSSKAGVLGRMALFLLFKNPKFFILHTDMLFLRTDISALSKKIYWSIEKGFQWFFGGETIACGDTEYEIARKLGKSSLVRNGIDIHFVRQNLKPNNNPVLTIGIVGRITYARNPKLFNKIALRFPHLNFVWIGDGELNHEITASNIRISGWLLDRQNVFAELNNIDIYMQTSLWEGLPIAMLEAMSLQKPILATNVIGNKDVVSNNVTGFLFDNIEELDHYFDVLTDENVRTAFGIKALERCRNLFDVNKNFTELIRKYQL